MKATFLITLLALLATIASIQAGQKSEEEEYDRLDGVGTSGKKVNVIEWEGNLEIHVYPKGSLKGLALKLDTTNKDKPVMVIGYRFKDNPKTQLIRRNILGIQLQNFRTFIDPTTEEYDKYIISQNGLSGQVKPYSLEPEPTQLYPDGHPMLAKKDDPKKEGKPARAPASAESQPGADPETGAIKPFFQ